MESEYLEKLSAQIEEHAPKLEKLSGNAMQKTVREGGWSGKEILGHLSDSAAINRQRIVRSQYENPYEFPAYDQNQWVKIQAYKNYDWQNLVLQWTCEYRHLVFILERLPEKSAQDKCPVKFSAKDFVNLDWLVGHMYRHNDHHLQQIYWLVGTSDLPDPKKLYGPIEALLQKNI